MSDISNIEDRDIMSIVKDVIVTDQNIGNGDNDGYAFNFAFIAGLYIIDQLRANGVNINYAAVSFLKEARHRKIAKISNIFYCYRGSTSSKQQQVIVWDVNEYNFIVVDANQLPQDRRYIRVGDITDIDGYRYRRNYDFIFFCLGALGDIHFEFEIEEQRQNYLRTFTKDSFNELCSALLKGGEVNLPVVTLNPDPLMEVRSIRVPRVPKESILHQVLTRLVPPTPEVTEISIPNPFSNIGNTSKSIDKCEENSVKWRIVAIIAASVLVSGFGFFMSFTSYIAFSAINIVAPLIATLGLAAAVALPVGIATKEHCNSFCGNKLVEKFRNRSEDKKPLLKNILR